MSQEFHIESINLKKLNPFDATEEELIAEALDENGLIAQDTKINGTLALDLLKSLNEKKRMQSAIRGKKSLITKVGSLLISRNVISSKQLRQALEYQKHTPVRIGEILVTLGFISKEQLAGIIEEQQRLRAILQQIQEREKLIVNIDYREPLFEKTINRNTQTPYTYSKFVDTLDFDQAILDAITEFVSNEQRSSVHWKSQIEKIRVSLNLTEDEL